MNILACDTLPNQAANHLSVINVKILIKYMYVDTTITMYITVLHGQFTPMYIASPNC